MRHVKQYLLAESLPFATILASHNLTTWPWDFGCSLFAPFYSLISVPIIFLMTVPFSLKFQHFFFLAFFSSGFRSVNPIYTISLPFLVQTF